jgi:hypothetical protein
MAFPREKTRCEKGSDMALILRLQRMEARGDFLLEGVSYGFDMEIIEDG